MDEKTHRRFTFIPGTRGGCWFSLVAGVLLLALEVADLTTHTVGNVYLTVLVAVLAVIMIVLAVVGLAVPRLRGR
ncbi:hypothetical protein [Amycolatopsis sp. PS_44_ISF1]|uniref:hypothetical protein n=1 Tax=Amycolatopsis sp. PS_44_ISF1 TaxID=2974917 RepID=UPI0028DE464C|nr:hypothetical protein [Amycolatopsis sp. PS_44_ISF1]MDT8914755.1 hypothetical protein [Amycolatopsis sp. PS_44_ISF1]